MVPIFLTFYRRFMKPIELVSHLIERFENDGYLPQPTEQQKRIHAILLLWLSHYWNDFYAPQPRKRLSCFLNQISTHYPFISHSLTPFTTEPPVNDPDCDWGSHSSSPCLNPPDPEFAGGQIDWMTPKEDLFIKTSDRHLAQQLTLIESQLFCPSIAHFNFVSAWVSTMIVSEARMSRRANVLTRWMSIASELRQLNNYNTLMAVLAGINNASVLRLRETRQLVDPKVIKDFESLESLMSTNGSYCLYRQALEETKGAGIPYLGVHHQDLISIDEANKDFRQDGSIHWNKFKLMGKTIMLMMKFKYVPYSIEPDFKLLSFIADYPILSDEAQYKRSIQIEPKTTANTTTTSRLKGLWQRLK
ncbi:hypothetical protein G6F37_011325 [Rhizopus arrhizus]|nr:hypothetical protein G6F38_007652 [Rhizopus arrhizus]KAG1149886.1 hypothetical protein G6F37_011325 [Rhizopus arrhizus]